MTDRMPLALAGWHRHASAVQVAQELARRPVHLYSVDDEPPLSPEEEEEFAVVSVPRYTEVRLF